MSGTIDNESLGQIAKMIAIQWKVFIDEGLPEEVATTLTRHFIDKMFDSLKERIDVNKGMLSMLKGTGEQS